MKFDVCVQSWYFPPFKTIKTSASLCHLCPKCSILFTPQEATGLPVARADSVLLYVLYEHNQVTCPV